MVYKPHHSGVNAQILVEVVLGVGRTVTVHRALRYALALLRIEAFGTLLPVSAAHQGHQQHDQPQQFHFRLKSQPSRTEFGGIILLTRFRNSSSVTLTAAGWICDAMG